MKQLFLSFTLLIFLLFSAAAQRLPVDPVVAMIHQIEKHPFDNTYSSVANHLADSLKKVIPMKLGDHTALVMLAMGINPSLKCLFTRSYILGKAAWVCSHKDTVHNDSAKAAGIKAINHLYGQIQQQNSEFRMIVLERLSRPEKAGKLLSFVKSMLPDHPDPYEIGEYDVPLVTVTKGNAKDTLYGYTPEKPIPTGMVPGYERGSDYLSHLRGLHGERLSYKMIHKGCEADLYNKITGKAALLDEYKVKIRGSEKSVVLYFDAYHEDTLYCPKGFTFINP